MHIRRIEFERYPPQQDGMRHAWLPGMLLVLLVAALAAAIIFPVGVAGAEGFVG